MRISSPRNCPGSRASRTAALGLLVVCAKFASTASVINLDSSNFDDYLNSHDVVLVEYYTSWCGICQELEPIYEQTAVDLDQSKDIRFVRVDCGVQSDICERHKIPIYPTIHAFQGTGRMETYNGPRESADMTRFVERRWRPVVATLTTDTTEAFKSSNEVAIVGYLDSHDNESIAILTAVAESLVDDVVFGITTDAELARSEGVSAPAIVLYKQYDEVRVVFDGKVERNAIAAFIGTASYPIIGEFEMRKAWRYFDEDRVPFAGVFSDNPIERVRLAEELRSIAESSRGKLNWATVDVSDPALAGFAEGFNLQVGPWPAISINDGQRRYPFGPGEEITQASLARYADDFIAGRLEPYKKAQPIPAAQDGPILVVVRDNFDQVVIDNDDDVLLEFYAPWCGYCNKLAPEYARLASLYAKHDKRVKIAMVDITANDIPGHIVGSYPTVKFFPAKAKDFPVQYLGNRTLEDLAQFVRVNSVAKVDIMSMMEESTAASSYLDKIRKAVGLILGAFIVGRTEKEDL